MYQRIVVPVDGSAATVAAYAEALKLARLTSAHLLLIHVLDVSRSALAPIGFPGLEYATYAETRQESAAHEQGLLQSLAGEAEQAGLKCDCKLIEEWGANPAKVLLAEADAWKADLIVMGTHGHSGLAHLIFGSVAENLLHHTTVPVLLVRKVEDDDD